MNCAELTMMATEQDVEEGEDEEVTKRRRKKIPPENGEKLCNVQK